MTVVITHVDQDAFAAAALVMMKEGRDTRALFINYNYTNSKGGFPFHQLTKGEKVYLTDFTAELDDMKRLHEDYNLIWIDHHELKCKETEKAIPGIPGVREYDKAACHIVWNYLYPDREPPLSLLMIAAYDIGDNTTYPGTKEFQTALWDQDNFPIGLGKLNLWQRILYEDEFREQLIERGRMIMELQARENAVKCRIMCEEINVFGYNTLVGNFQLTDPDQFKSIINVEKHDMLIGFYKYSMLMKDTNTYTSYWKFSIRKIDKPSTESLHLGELFAKHYPGAGGHAGAAGFTVDKLSQVEWLRHVV